MDPVAKKNILESEYYPLSEDEQTKSVVIQQAKFDTSIFARLLESQRADLYRLIEHYKIYG